MTNSIPSSTLEKFTTFGDLLRFLRRRIGITQTELAIAVGYSHTQISRLEQNLRLPDIPTIQARFVSALGLEEEPNVVLRLLDLAANVRREDVPVLGLCPYKGLNYFDESDADLFVGREELTARLTERVLSLSKVADSTRLLAIVGASGSGKSSLVRAGLIPALRWNKKSADWQIHILTPTANPLENLAASLTADSDSVIATSTLIDDLWRDPRSLYLFIKRQLPVENHTQALLVIDQFEEVFALCRSEEERISFFSNLLTVASEVNGTVMVVIALRADFYAHCANHIQLREALAGNQEYIGSMNVEELRRAIEEPAQRGRWEFESGLVDLLLHDVGHEPGALPLLSHALMETWQRRRGRTMTMSGYASSGGVRGAIAETAEAVFADQFTSEQRSIARRIFLRLTELGDEASAADTRRRATFDELILNPDEANMTHTVLKSLADARLIITTEDSAEVAHEALIREWPTLHGWLEENREGLRLHRQLTEAAQEWLALDRSKDILYRGTRLAQATEWTSIHKEELNASEREFLAASIEESEREIAERKAQRQRELETAQTLAEAQRQRAEAEKQRAEIESQRAEEQTRAAGQLRTRSIYLAGAFVIVLILGITALFFSIQAREAARVAQAQERIAFSRELAAAAISNLNVDPELSLLISQEAVLVTYSVDQSWTTEAEDALRRALQASRLELTLRGHTNSVEGVVFSPDGTLLATASHDKTLKVWDLATGQELLNLYTNADQGQLGIAFSHDGTKLAAPSVKGTAKVWNPATGKEPLTLSGHTDWVNSVAFNPNGTLLATASDDRMVKIWDALTGREILTLRGHTAPVSWVTFSPDGVFVATASQDATAKLWDATTGEEIRNFTGHDNWVNGLAFSPDGILLATASGDWTAKVWQVATGEELLTLSHDQAVARIAISPDGTRLATTSLDGKTKVWDIMTGEELLTLSGHTDAVIGVAFSPDCVHSSQVLAGQCETHLATTSWDGSVKVWNVSFSRNIEDLLALAQKRITRSLTAEECKKYLHVEPCPAEP